MNTSSKTTNYPKILSAFICIFLIWASMAACPQASFGSTPDLSDSQNFEILAQRAPKPATEGEPAKAPPLPSTPKTDPKAKKTDPKPPKTVPKPDRPDSEIPSPQSDQLPQPDQLAQSDLLSDWMRSSSSNRSFNRLAGIPKMFGDFQAIRINAAYEYYNYYNYTTVTDLPQIGGRTKVAENNNAIADDRVFFLYNHFHNSLTFQESFLPGYPSVGARDFSTNRYTLGFEKRFGCGLWSVEMRLPLSDSSIYSADFPYTGTNSMSADRVGNLAVIIKRMLCCSQSSALAAGLAIDMPLGSDVRQTTMTDSYIVYNEAVHISPYLAYTSSLNEKYFVNAFMQVDVAANGNPIDLNSQTAHFDGMLGKVNEQTLMMFDVCLGRWLCRNPCSRQMTGLAAIVEFHYTNTLQDADIVSLTQGQSDLWSFGNMANRIDELNLSVGLHVEMRNRTRLRVGGVVPLRTDDDRDFDSEVQVQLDRRF